MSADVCVVGGGPAGLMLGLLLARAGVPVAVLEKHPDFLRDFRGDTVHPSTIRLLDRLGLAEGFLDLPHRKVGQLRLTIAGRTYQMVDFTRLPGPYRYLAFLPQWDFLDFLADEAANYPHFTLLRSTEVVDVIRDGDAVRGVRAQGPDGPVEVSAALTVGCDGRDSAVRRVLRMTPREFGAPMDVLWFRLPRRPGDGDGLMMRAGAGRLMLTIDRGDYWQIAYVIPKGGYDQVVARGLAAFRASVSELAETLADRVGQLDDWEQVKMLTVQLNRLERWHVPGALLIGDAAHAMSPIGGVGVNLAIQDAVATARLLAEPLRAGRLTEGDLERVRRRRRLPTVGTQLVQRVMQRGVLDVLTSGEQTAPLAIRLVGRLPVLQGLPARLIGLGIRPEYEAPAPAPLLDPSA
ncbi:MAG: FAD-dependent oxidoreductase [Micromonosporaceae bacterium]|nr:FAD-dependent oxidoreductase [Micromonosporaceae bacterium]